MGIQRSRKILNVFLASPGDLAEERSVVRKVVDELNRSLAREVGLAIELLGWEDTLPGGKRPQELINEDVDACDLFVGMLWRRWGQSTGTFSSGFEEEFERVRAKRSRVGDPEIWLYFKAVDPDQIADAGEQLQRVLDFRAERETRKDLLFREFETADAFEDEIREALLRYTLKLAITEVRAAEEPTSSVPVPADIPRPTSGSDSKDIRSGAELVELFTTTAELARSALTRGQAVSSADLTNEQIVRLLLFAAAGVSHDHTRDVLGTHEQNLVFRIGRTFELTLDEITLLIRGVLRDSNDVVPGWAWFPGLTSDGIRYFAASDFDPEVRRGALRALTRATAPFESDDSRRDFFAQLLGHDDVNVVRDALAYFRAVARVPDMPVLAAVNHVRLRTDLPVVHTSVLLREGMLDEAVQLVSGLDTLPKQMAEVLKGHAKSFTSDHLDRLLTHADADVRLVVLQELRDRQALTPDIVHQLTSDKSAALRRIAFAAMLTAGESVQVDDIKDAFKDEIFPSREKRQLLVQLFERHPDHELEKLIDWYSTDSDEAYEALARKSMNVARVRTDLASDFAELKERSIAMVREKFGDAGVEYFAARWEPKLDKFVIESLREAALRVLGDLGDVEDRSVMRASLSDTRDEIREVALRFFERVGTEEDAEVVVDLAKREPNGRLAKRAAELAMSLSGSPSLAEELISGGGTAAVAVITCSRDRPDLLSDEQARRLLNNADGEVRRAATAVIGARLDPTVLEAVLDEYVSQDHYFYNVVCWLDRLLYAPAELADHFATTIAEG